MSSAQLGWSLARREKLPAHCPSVVTGSLTGHPALESETSSRKGAGAGPTGLLPAERPRESHCRAGRWGMGCLNIYELSGNPTGLTIRK